jgi:hypothetical protein
MINIIFIGESHLEDGEMEDRGGHTKINTGKMVAEYAKPKSLNT